MLFFTLAWAWLIGGVGLLVYQTLSGDDRLTLHVFDVPLSAGWIMVVMSGYNFVRWWTRRGAPVVRREAGPLSRRQRVRRVVEPTERDPNFIFTDDPPPPAPPTQDSPPAQH